MPVVVVIKYSLTIVDDVAIVIIVIVGEGVVVTIAVIIAIIDEEAVVIVSDGGVILISVISVGPALKAAGWRRMLFMFVVAFFDGVG